MSDGGEDQLASPEVAATFERFILEQSRLLRQAAHVVKGTNEAVFWISLAICGTCAAVALLARRALSNDAVMLFRALTERVINACYLMVCDKAERDRFEAYSRQKAFRRLDSEVRAGGEAVRLTYEGRIDPSAVPALEEALQHFTSSRGREITRWSNTTLQDRIRLISERSEITTASLLMCLLLYYEDASEALHGTFYGCTFHLGVHRPGIKLASYDDLFDHFRGASALMLYSGGEAVHQLIRLIAKSVDIDHIVRESTESADAAAAVLKRTVQAARSSGEDREPRPGWLARWRSAK